MSKEKALEFLKDFINELDTQDTRATRNPIQFLLQQKREYVAHDEYNHNCETVFRHSEMESNHCTTQEEAEQWLEDYGYEGDRLKEEIENIEQFEIGHYWETSQAFFTKRGLDQHLALNKHNLREHRDWVTYAFRNPEFENLIEAVREIIKSEVSGG